MKKLTPEEFAAMTCKELRAWVHEHCVQRPAGRPSSGLTKSQRQQAWRERKRESNNNRTQRQQGEG